MKNETKPTQEEKEQYMAVHIGCQFNALNCLTTLDHVRLGSESPFGWIDTLGQRIYSFSGMACLTSLSDITDEDAIEVAKIFYPSSENWSKKMQTAKDGIRTLEQTIWSSDDEFSVFGINEPATKIIQLIDFLRSRSYAVRWRKYSVDQLMSFGWLKLRQKGGGM